jgi:DNA-directed RNA polymerase specialized sigma24 family protein
MPPPDDDSDVTLPEGSAEGLDDKSPASPVGEVSDEPTAEELGISNAEAAPSADGSANGASSSSGPKDDGAKPPSTEDLRARLSDRKLVADLVAHVRWKHFASEDVANDVVQLTYLRAIKAKSWPKESRWMLAWMKRISDNGWKDYGRSRKRARREEPRADVDVADDRPTLELEKKVLRAAEKVASENDRAAADVEMLKEHASGKTHVEIAADRGLTEVAVRQRTHRVAQRIREFAMCAAAAFAVLLLVLKPAPNQVHAVRPWPSPEDPLLPLPPHRSAAEERGLALKACQVKEYAACLGGLNQARRMDPEGEKEPAVVAARREAERAVLGRSPP